ncbi:MAG: hypothetical protein ACP5QI_06450, partial [Candidatus Bathyarchaeia archaeon]
GPDGLGNPNNHDAVLFVFKNKLYAGTYNDVDGSEIWVSPDGVKFAQLVSDGLGERDNSGIDIPLMFNDKLLVPVSDGNFESIKDGAEIWISEDGENFRRAIKDGLGDKSNIAIHFLVSPFKHPWTYVEIQAVPFKGHVYLGTVNPSGGEIWRSKDGVEWERMVDNGFGDVENVHVIPELTFRDQLYVVTANYLDGLNVFRSTDGKVWERVVENAFGYGGKNPFEVLTEINGTLYLCVAGTWPLGVFQIWKSDDGKNWIQVGQTGFGNENNFFGGIGLGSDGFLYVSTLNPVDGLEAWRSKDGLKWEMIFKESVVAKLIREED